MRIAHVMLAKKFGGAERSFVDLVLALAGRGHEVLAIGEARGSALALLQDIAGVETREVRCYGSWDRLAEQHIRRELARFAPTVVHAHLARAAHLGGRAAHALGVPTVAKTHNLVNLKYYQHIDVLVPTTAAQADYLAARGTHAALQRIPNFSRLAAVDAIPSPPSPPYRIAGLGRFVHKKGFDVLIEACGYLVDAGVDLVLDLGGDGRELAALTRDISRHGLEGRVRLRGWIDDVSTFLDGAHLFVLPSRDEPFGIVLLEAMARGVPIVATRTQGPREVLDGTSAWLVDADDPAALAAAMRVALDPATGAERASHALARYRETYSEAPVVAQYLDLYARLQR
ncbi:MAG: glycosyltransferase [Gammaproteobacteria bacterium]